MGVELSLSVDDVDVGLEELVVRVSARNGGINGREVEEKVEFVGCLSWVNEQLAGLTYKGRLNWWGLDTVTVEIGPDVVRNMFVDVQPVNDYPEVRLMNEVPGQNVNGNGTKEIDAAEYVVDLVEDVKYNIDFVSVWDVDLDDLYKDRVGAGVSGHQLEVELKVGSGELSWDKGFEGVLVVISSPRRIVLRGGVDDLNVLLSKLIYLNDENFNGDDSLWIIARDFGIDGGGGGASASVVGLNGNNKMLSHR